MKIQRGRRSTRLRDFDYASDQVYFITMVCKGREHFLGKVIDEAVELSKAGFIVAQQWLETPRVRPEIRIDCFVVMPNHTHGIVVLGNPTLPETADGRITGARWTKTEWKSMPRTVGSLVAGFKSACTVSIRQQVDPSFGWQRNYHDRIIRDRAELASVRAYIRNNPRNWTEDDVFR